MIKSQIQSTSQMMRKASEVYEQRQKEREYRRQKLLKEKNKEQPQHFSEHI